MGVLGIAGFGIQKRGELLARHPRQCGLHCAVASKSVRKHHKLTSELRSFSNTFVQYQIHHISLFELIRFILSKDFPGGHFKKFEFSLISARIWRAGGACREREREQKLEADALVPIISGARARRLHGFWGRWASL